MPNFVQINNLTGSSPFLIEVCDQTITYCFSISAITTTVYTFQVPFPLEETTPIILKITDSNNCEKIYLLSCEEIYGKEFENLERFLFQDADIYLFEGS